MYSSLLNSKIFKRLVLFFLLLSPGVAAYAADNATATKSIAGALLNLNHFPSDAEKAELVAIAEDDGVGRAFRAVANAVANIQHSAQDSDKDIMNRIIASERAHDNAKMFAEILLNLNHSVGEEAKLRLQELL